MAFASYSTNYSPVRNYSPAPSYSPAQNYSPAPNYSPIHYTPYTPSVSSNVLGTSTEKIPGSGTTPDYANYYSPQPSNPGFNEKYLQNVGYTNPTVISNILKSPESYSVYQDYLKQSNPQQITDQINSAYGDVNGYLDNFENQVKSGQQSFLDQYTKPYDAQIPQLTQARDEALTANTQQQDASRLQEQNALASARQLYSELNQANRQRFGGTGSAGEFANAIQGREYQKNVGNIQNTAGQNNQNLLNQATNIQKNYQSQLQSLQAQKDAVLAQAQSAFQEKLNQIASARMQSAQAKANAQLAALQELRNTTQGINNAFLTQQLGLQNLVAQAVTNTAAAVQQYRAQNGGTVDLASIPQSVFSTVGGGVADTGYLPQGLLRRRADFG